MQEQTNLRITIPLADTPKGLHKLKTTPTKKLTRMTVVCTDECDTCIMFKLGCARRCTRFPDIVCEGCPCRSSAFAGKITVVGEDEE